MHGVWFDYRLDEATDTGRVHHQLIPNDVKYEANVDEVSLKVFLCFTRQTVPLSVNIL